jgi:hypothetical protein
MADLRAATAKTAPADKVLFVHAAGAVTKLKIGRFLELIASPLRWS